VREKRGGDEGKKWIKVWKEDARELFQHEGKGERKMKVNNNKRGKKWIRNSRDTSEIIISPSDLPCNVNSNNEHQ
jgi:hypothetical protein